MFPVSGVLNKEYDIYGKSDPFIIVKFEGILKYLLKFMNL